MLNLGLNSDALHIDAAEYEDQPETAALVRAISTAVEAERARRRASEPMIGPLKSGFGGGLLGDLPAYHLCDRTPWYELLMAEGPLDECAAALGIDLTELLHRIIQELLPPNWTAFFWMKAYLGSVPASYHHAMVQLASETAAQAEAKRIRQERGSSGGLGKAKRVYGPAREHVRREWLEHGETGYRSKSDFARFYMGEVMRLFETEVTEKTIRESWLKGL